MLAKRVIPCLDVDRGRVVKGTNFVNLRDAGDPVAVAARYEQEGADELVFLDITASHEGRDIMLDVVRRTADEVFMPLTVGGGIRTLDDIRALLLAGCDKVSINSAAVKDPDFVAEAADKFGDQCIVVSLDCKKVSAGGETDRWEIFTHGGRNPTGLDAVEFARAMVKRGANFNALGARGWEWFELVEGPRGVAINWRGLGAPDGEGYGGDPLGTCNSCHQMAAGNDFVLSEALTLR